MDARTPETIALWAGLVSAVAAVATVVVGTWQGWLTLPIRRLAKRDLRQTTTPDPAASRPAPRVEAAQSGAGVALQLRRLPVAVRGRELLVRSLRSQLANGGMVVLTGPGGVGKSTVGSELVPQIQAPEKADQPPDLVAVADQPEHPYRRPCQRGPATRRHRARSQVHWRAEA